MERHGDTYWGLARAITKGSEKLDSKTIATWKSGFRTPRSIESMKYLGRIESRYRLPAGYFKDKLPHPGRAAVGHSLGGIRASERRRMAWHLPDDFDDRSAAEQAEILEWVRRVIVSGSTEYRLYQARALKQRYAVRFSSLSSADPPGLIDFSAVVDDHEESESRPDVTFTSIIEAPARLATEMASLVRFKTSTLAELGFQRSGVWGEASVQQRAEHFGLLFGALVASPKSQVGGLGISPQRLTFGLLAFPVVWDWYVNWRERRRGFYTSWEVDMLRVGLALMREETGWIRQHPELAQNLSPLEGLISRRDIELARSDWNATCDRFYKHALGRVKEIRRVARVHRDPFEPILAILEADSPLGEYKKITDEIVRLKPDERRYPVAAAEAMRSFLLLRFGLHLGLRQRNLRQLLLCARNEKPRSERQLEDMRCGELRWSEREVGWEVFIPAVAFKNAASSFFGSKPFRLVLPNLDQLYDGIDSYVGRHRRVLLKGARDPGTFFVKTVKSISANAAYNQSTFYEAWRLVIQRYGIFNPYTLRGAVKGLLPHGPHNVRDVLATHILKQTGSYEQASYAIQDTPDMVAKHYGRFLPQDKAALAAQVLNQVWQEA
ncbi:hypothetical protein AYO42_03475 [Rhizomicrobium sp. SCGC AG-212-E05]|nr:hypothetical protein AYO42_03475 [Rhizomicrobium sp. SCGC AG-212-E05]